MEHLKRQPLFRALGLLWSRLGRARIYVLFVLMVLLVLAAVGFVQLISPGSAPSEPVKAKTSGPLAGSTPVKEPLIAITEIGSTETRGRNGQRNVEVKIGVAPRPNIPKGEVEIRVSFFDVTEANEMRPTEAEVNYEWLTPVRNWNDPTPKYLVATYEGAGSSRQAAEKIRYGGFVVRVYFEGQLQAERSEPKGLVAALRNEAKPSVAPAAAINPAAVAIATPTAQVSQPRVSGNEQTERAVAQASLTPSQPSLNSTRESSAAIPYASPVPDKPGFVYSPHNPKFLIDVRGFPPGTEVNDPNTGKLFKVP